MLVGLGMWSITDYKYVRILIIEDKEDRAIVHVFSVRENRWRLIDASLDLWLIHGQAVLLDEKLYWEAYSTKAGQVIASFDLPLETFDIFSCRKSETLHLLGVTGYCLFRGISDDRLVDMLKPPTVVKSVSLPKGVRIDFSSEMIGFTSTGKFFVTSPSFVSIRDCRSRVLWLVDPSTESMQYSMLLRFEGSINIAKYVPSLVSPFSNCYATRGLETV
ncbi:hypothetical protein RND81_05G099000 [Saponaria officinalis]|uniref:F-box associated beta-propeller type 1 domain-containing protein n=1 Tax=Saponaria officinalis TaxID=3572 RepID=A0AAW1KXF3_SAPOF